MKPVKNISLSAFAIGKTYRVNVTDDLSDDLDITIVSIFSCNVDRCRWKARKDKCEGIMFDDEEGHGWCGMLADFTEVKA